MQRSALEEHFGRHAVALTNYRGSLVGGNDPAELEFQPWPEGRSLLYDASWRAVLKVEGAEARKWLNGMITANVRDLKPGTFTPSFQLDPKGHILADLEIGCTGPDAFLLLTDEAQRAGLEQRLRRFVFVSKVTIEDLSATWSALRLRGPQVAAVARQAGWVEEAPEPGTIRACAGGGWTLASMPGGVTQLECVAPAEAIVALWEKLEPLATPAGGGTQERDRIFSRVPLYGADITEAELPQETGQMDHLDFCKGCYIGQEIVERIRSRGAVHRRWSAFRFPAAVEAGTALAVAERAAGKLTSVAKDARGWFALGYVRDAQPGQTAVAAGVSGQILA